MNTKAILGLIAIACIGLAGCSPESRDQYDQAGKNISEGTKQAGSALATDAKKAAGATSDAVKSAGAKLKDVTGNAKDAVDSDIQAGKVKSALNSASGLEAKNINVDCDAAAKTITLTGTVPDQNQKDRAETIVKGMIGSDYQLISKLAVPPKNG